MKRIALTFLGIFLATGVFAQAALDKFYLEEIKKAKETSDKDLKNEKAVLKASYWMSRGQAYQDVAMRNLKLDSTAATVAFEAYKKAIELDTKDGKEGSKAKEARTAMTGGDMYTALLLQGDAMYKAKKYENSVAAMKLAASTNPKKDTTVYLYLGVLGTQVKDNELARSSWEKMIEWGAKDPSTFYSLSQIYRTEATEKKDKSFEDKAIAAIEKGIVMNPGNKDLVNEKINLLLGFNRLESAIVSLKESIEKDPKNVTNIVNLGILYDNAFDKQKSEVKKLTEDLAHGTALKAKITAQTEKLSVYTDEAKRISDNLKKQPKNADLKRRLDETNKSIADQNTEIATLKEDLKKEEAKGINIDETKKKIETLTKGMSDNKASAKAYYEKALGVDAKNYDALYNLGVMHFNDAVEIKKKVDNMDMKTFQTEGKAVEEAANNKFKEAMPYFETAYSVKKEDDVKGNLITLYRILKLDDKLKAIGE